MSYPLFLYELRYVHSPVVPGLTGLAVKHHNSENGKAAVSWYSREALGTSLVAPWVAVVLDSSASSCTLSSASESLVVTIFLHVLASCG
jgi:hypothetical protein